MQCELQRWMYRVRKNIFTNSIMSIIRNFFPFIRTSAEDIINPIQSARMRTLNSFSFTYGTVEVRAKMPRGDWIWPGMIL
jgi:hypothetical protein